MKKISHLIITLTLIILSGFQSFGQERVNRDKITFIDSSEIMRKATGWTYDNTRGQWFEHKNTIPIIEDQDFLSVQTKTIFFNSKKYYVLIVAKLDGNWEYPSIHEGWYTYNVFRGYIFTENEYNKLYALDTTTLDIKIKYDVNMINEFNEVEFLDLIQNKILTAKEDPHFVLIMPIKKSTEGAIRFYLPCYHFQYDFKKRYFETDSVNFSKIIIK